MQPKIKDQPPAIFLAVRYYTTISEIPKIAGDLNVPAKVADAAERAGLEIVGPSTFIYFGAEESPNAHFDLLIAVPVNAYPPDIPDGFEVLGTSRFHCLSVEYVGSMPNIQTAYRALRNAIHEQKLTPTFEAREIYKKWVDFDSEENITEIQIGIAQSA